MNRISRFGALVGAALVAVPVATQAHVTLEKPEGVIGTSYKAVFRVPHGCDGNATTAVKVKIPEGAIAAKPQPKPGWEVTKVTGDYASPHDHFGTELTSGVVELDWTGGHLGDDEYDEFVAQVYLSKSLKPGDMLYFPVVQECGGDTFARWIEIPAAGQDPHDLEGPAPGLHLVAKP